MVENEDEEEEKDDNINIMHRKNVTSPKFGQFTILTLIFPLHSLRKFCASFIVFCS